MPQGPESSGQRVRFNPLADIVNIPYSDISPLDLSYSVATYESCNKEESVDTGQIHPPSNNNNNISKLRHSFDNVNYNYYNMLFSNVTFWGPKAQSYIMSKDIISNDDIHCIVENHIPAHSLGDLENQYGKWGMRVSANPARDSLTSNNGTHGGEHISYGAHFDITPISPERNLYNS